ncbi:hypothetical protein WALSEDRAFT_66532 [Wallemia mellicola CBS 633.66]|uniref:Invertebrate defensins family profile domain-containing protein n=1 Tax=Wallemia mellicola (strain ATCC MYA-4683 / CBS 633.66) TaxID=671144 RepID=I4Y5G9_WALMC|nr:hypothetical protein WALSEDRAFT_66532 [Wallemia mellicola CBS 633.66]EIM19211.1 hypothetical protein WALSEDRAFT_66532 [Wallemia mellicola CBS 633.66]|eukprot:XP_006960708.1 hypothetical protein WALSEDRAFT_66532 [Wallemia mellicola CBS 633.66]
MHRRTDAVKEQMQFKFTAALLTVVAIIAPAMADSCQVGGVEACLASCKLQNGITSGAYCNAQQICVCTE